MEFPATEKLPQGKLEVNLMKIIPGGEYAYEYLVGCKTGYTADARSCLVSCAEKDGMRLICVVLKDEAPYQYEDTISLFQYGFSNFEKVNVSQTENKFNIEEDGLFYGGNDILGSSTPFLSLNKDDFIVLPRTASFEDTQSVISYETAGENEAALITYTYHGVNIGTVRVNFAGEKKQQSLFDTSDGLSEEASETQPASSQADSSVIFVNILRLFTIIAGILLLIVLFLLFRAFLKNYAFPGRNTRKSWRKKRRKRNRTLKMPRSRRFRD